MAGCILSHMCFLLPVKSRQFLYQRRHHSDPIVNKNRNEELSIDINDESLTNVFT